MLSAPRCDGFPCLPSVPSAARPLASLSLLIPDGGTSLSDRVFILPRRNHYLFPKEDLFYSLTFLWQLLYNLLQSLSRSRLKRPESSSRVWARNSTASCVISNELPRRLCCRSKFKNHCIHPPWESISINLSPPFMEVNHSPWAASRVEKGHGQGLLEAIPLSIPEDGSIQENEQIPKSITKTAIYSKCLHSNIYYCCCSVSKVCPNLCDPWKAARQASLSFTISRSLLKFMSIESVVLSNHLILYHPLLLLPQSFPASGSFPMSQLFTSGG